tara:strand:+ start:3572 stop:4063 length:492 start_codon:yes stop_codon:yes gene_type:complete
MKKISIIILLAITSFSAISQEKIGYVDIQEIFQMMPEAKAMEVEIKKLEETLGKQLQSMYVKYQSEQNLLKENQKNLSEAEIQDKLLEIQSLGERIQTFEQNAQVSIQEKVVERQKPIEELIIKAIDEVSEEGGYTYIINKQVLLHYKKGSDILPLVKKKLGL